MALDIQPVEGMVALQILDDDTDEKSERQTGMGLTPDDSYNEALHAIVIGIGPKGPAGVKKGNVVLCRGYARNGLDVGDGVVLTDVYCIAGVVK